MEQNTNEIDVRKILRVVTEYWWCFAASVAFFVLLGTAYYLRKAPQWTTDAAIMLRQKDMGADDALSSLSMLGLAGNTAAEDEVVVLSSRGLLYQTIDALNLWEGSSKRGGLRWETEFPGSAL